MKKHRRSAEELEHRAHVNISVRGSSLVRLRTFRDQLCAELGTSVSLSQALDIALTRLPQKSDPRSFLER